MAVKTPKQRQNSRAASRRRRRRQTIVTLAILALLLVAAIVLVCVLNGNSSEPEGNTPSAETTGTTETTTVTETTGTTESETTVTNAPTEPEPTEPEPTEPEPTEPAPTEPLPTTPISTEGHYVQPEGAAWNLILANDWNTLSQTYVESLPLETVTEIPLSMSGWNFDSRALPYLAQMVEAANAAGCGLWGQSLYRPYETQYTLYWQEVNLWLAEGYGQEEAERIAATIVKRAGQSEHNTGLALDFECSEYPYLDEGFKNTAAYTWLIENCADYGFILRFPEGKEDITGVIYEPWHYRYVGVEAAQEIMSRGLCLEEYLEEKGL